MYCLRKGKENPKNKGENNGISKLKETDVIKIKELLEEGVIINKIADLYKVGQTTIYNIKSEKIWKHIVIPYVKVIKEPKEQFWLLDCAI